MNKLIIIILALTIIIYKFNCCSIGDPCLKPASTYKSAVPSNPGIVFFLDEPINNEAPGTIITDIQTGTFGAGIKDIKSNLTSGFVLNLKGSNNFEASFYTNSIRNDTWKIRCIQQLAGQTTIQFQMPICDSTTNTIAYSKDSTELQVNINDVTKSFKVDALFEILWYEKCN